MQGPSSPSDRKLVQALGSAGEPGMRKLIVGMLTKDAWQDDEIATEVDIDEEFGLDDDVEPDELSPANIKAVLRWTFDIDLTDN